MTRLALLGGLLALMRFMNAEIDPTSANLPARALLGIGFIILGGYLMGSVARSAGMPRLTGYLLAGFLSGPGFSGLVHEDVRSSLKVVEQIALSFIAFNAGGEMEIGRLRARFLTLTSISVASVSLVFVLVSSGMYVLLSNMEVLHTHQHSVTVAAALILGVVATAMGPAPTIAILLETRAKGILPETVLALVVMADLFILVLFTLVLGLADMLVHDGAQQQLGGLILPILWEITGSLLLGGLLGIGVIQFLKALGQEVVFGLFVIAVLVIEVTSSAHLPIMLVCMVAGFVVNNYSKEGHRLIMGIEAGSVAVYIIFFTLAGTYIRMDGFLEVFPAALAYFVLRAGGFIIGSRIGAMLAGAEDLVRNWVWSGMLSQAGVALGLALLVREKLPVFDGVVASIIISGIVLDELIGPVTFMRVLRHVGEADKQES